MLWYLQFAWEQFGATCHHSLNTDRTGICHGKHTLVGMFIQSWTFNFHARNIQFSPVGWERKKEWKIYVCPLLSLKRTYRESCNPHVLLSEKTEKLWRTFTYPPTIVKVLENKFANLFSSAFTIGGPSCKNIIAHRLVFVRIHESKEIERIEQLSFWIAFKMFQDEELSPLSIYM